MYIYIYVSHCLLVAVGLLLILDQVQFATLRSLHQRRHAISAGYRL